jgi:hypothetical protein
MAKELTAGDLTLLRSEGQHSHLRMAIPATPVIFTARVNQATPPTDMVVEITYDGGAGDFTDIEPGMTMWVGSTPGADDIGQCLIRKAATATILYIGEASELNWQDNLYLTIIDEHGIWVKEPYVDLTGEEWMDHDVEYTDQNTNMDPVVVCGPDAIASYNGDYILHPGDRLGTGWDLTDSWSPDGSEIVAWHLDAPGAAEIIDPDTAQPYPFFDHWGTYRLKFTITTANGKTGVAYRTVMVFDEDHLPISQFNLRDMTGSKSQGGWQFSVTFYDEASLAEIHERAKVILFSTDYYGPYTSSQRTKVGPFDGYLTGRNGLVAIGWISGENLEIDTVGGTAEFTVQGPQYWLGQASGMIKGIENNSGTADAWTNIHDLTVDKGLWQLLKWRSTATEITDCRLTGDTRLTASVDASPGSLWEQINSIASSQILAGACCDRYGRIFVEIDAQYIPVADRTGIVEVMEITKKDRGAQLHVERRVVPAVGMVSLSGTSYDGSTPSAFFAFAPGHLPKRWGTEEAIDQLNVTDQANAMALAGLVLGQRNNEWPVISMVLQQNNRAIDVCPNQYVSTTIEAEDNPRGVTFSGRMLPREIQFIWNEKTNFLSTALTCEAESFPEISVIGDTPQNAAIGDTPLPPLDFPVSPPPLVFTPRSTSVVTYQGDKDFIELVSNRQTYHYGGEGDLPEIIWNTRTQIKGTAFTWPYTSASRIRLNKTGVVGVSGYGLNYHIPANHAEIFVGSGVNYHGYYEFIVTGSGYSYCKVAEFMLALTAADNTIFVQPLGFDSEWLFFLRFVYLG